MGPRKIWNEKSIERCKQRIKAELTSIEQNKGMDARKEYLLNKIRWLETSASNAKELLDLYVYLMSLLVLDSRLNFLTPARVTKTVDLVRSILHSQGILETKSRLSHLHGELHSILSQINRSRGDHWNAAWNQFLSSYVTRGHRSEDEGFKRLSMAHRAMRLGYLQAALDDLLEAKSILDGSLFQMACVSEIRLLRLQGHLQEAKNRIEVLASHQLSASIEKICVHSKVHTLLFYKLIIFKMLIKSLKMSPICLFL